MKHYILVILFCAMSIAGCKTVLVTDEPFFRSREMRDTLDAYLSRIDTSYSTTECPMVTFVVVHDMLGKDAPMLFITTTRKSEVAYTSASDNTHASQRFFGKYRGHNLLLTLDSKYKCLFKRGLIQSERAKEEYLLKIRRRTLVEHNELDEGEVLYKIRANGGLELFSYEESIYNYKHEGTIHF